MEMVKMTTERKRDILESAGIFVGKRDPARNARFSGQFMVCEDVTESPSGDASNGGFCVVGDDLETLIEEAYVHFAAYLISEDEDED